MRTPAKGASLLGLGLVVAFSGRPARAAEAPLLVVVEAPPALEADAAEIRRAIGAELRCQTVAPMKTTADAPERALIVAIDAERIAMSLRSGDGPPVTRVIPAPAERAARLRAIAWLAGNLARDQVSPILAESPPEPSPLATVPPLPATSAPTEPPPAPTASPTTAPSSPLPPPSDAGGATSPRRAAKSTRPSSLVDQRLARTRHRRFRASPDFCRVVFRPPAGHRLADHPSAKAGTQTARHRGDA